MQIDPFTLIAQIVNFLILVLLLRRFLYGPIIRTMDERERRIAAELEEAASKESEARREARECHAEKVKLEDSRGEMLTRAQEEATELKRKMVAEARSEIEESKSRWSRAIKIEKDTFLQNLRQRAGEEVYAISRQVITDLANIELERHIIDTFIERLQGLEDSERAEIATAARRTREGAVITTSFPIDRETRHRLIAVVGEQVAGDIKIRFDTSADLICGIELRAAGKKAAWSMQNYLETLDEKLGLAFSGVREEI